MSETSTEVTTTETLAIEDRSRISDPAVTETPVEKVKKIRSEAQKLALEQARQKALQMRAQKKLEKEALKTQEKSVETPLGEKPAVEEQEKEETEPEVEYVRRPKKPKPKKRVIVVEESSSSEDEIEVRLPKRKTHQERLDAKTEHFQRSYDKMFSL